MSEQEFESYLRLMGRLLNLSAAQRDRIAGELRDHMEERLAELVDQGVARDAAIMQALDEFGDAAGLANDFTQAAKSRRRRLLMRTGIGTIGVAAAIVLVSAILPMRHDANSTAPPLANAADAPGRPAPGAPGTPPTVAHRPTTRPTIELTVGGGLDVADVQTLAKLGEKDSFNFDNTRLVNVIDFFRARSGVNFDVNWSALQAAGVNPDSTVSLMLDKVAISKALKLTLSHLNPEAQFVVQDGMVLISTREDLNRHTEIRIYNCRDLIGGATVVPMAAPQAAITGGGGGGGGGPLGIRGTSVPGGYSPPPALDAGEGVMAGDDGRIAARSVGLINLLEDLIEHDSWQAAGGTVGSINEFDGLLVVRHTASVHQQISELLDMLREASAKLPQPRAAARPVAGAAGGSGRPAVPTYTEIPGMTNPNAVGGRSPVSGVPEPATLGDLPSAVPPPAPVEITPAPRPAP